MSSIKRLIPLFDRVLVQRIKAAERTASGLYIPEKAQETINEGLVIEVGPGLPGKDGKLVPLAVQKGDHVLLPQYGGNVVKFSGEEYTLFNVNEILAKLEKN
ncbi:10 kDa heat shock protein [Boothiomyces sp. JEL0838]|nr:10 kDa heat shock protein [Boothiomyces sp. JEL0838]